MAESADTRLWPIVYVRGYAMTQSEVEDTVADPYMGFNLGSSKIRQLWTGQCQRYFFESPLVRLMKDYGYRDVYNAGDVMPAGHELKPQSIFIYRYYERTSVELGTGQRLEIEDAAVELGELIHTIRDRFCNGDANAEKTFRVYLVAHSMGGLVCRALLQNPKLGASAKQKTQLKAARQAVDKVFTYATPHNGIDLALIGNVPGIVTANDADNFNRKRMRQYLALPASAEDVGSLNGHFDPDRFFNLVGTNERDYGIVRNAVGPMSDGLVRIVNATTWGPFGTNGKKRIVHSPRAFVHRSHSGHYGIVNSEEGYQNLIRFLFGDVRVDGVLDVHELTLPPELQKIRDEDKGKKKRRKIRASYHFEAVVRVRGAMWDLHRRTVSENSAVFRQFDDLFPPEDSNDKPRPPHLFSAFLSARGRVKPDRPGLGFSVDLGVLVPQYELDNRLWFDHHFEGGYLFRDKVNLEAIPLNEGGSDWNLNYGFDSVTPNRATTKAKKIKTDVDITFEIPIEQNTQPGIKATLVLHARPWR